MDTVEEIINFGPCINDWIKEGLSHLNLTNLNEIKRKILKAKENSASIILEDLLKDSKLRAEDAMVKGLRRKMTAEKENREYDTTSTIKAARNNATKDELYTTESGRRQRNACTDATEKVIVELNNTAKTKLHQIKTERFSEEAGDFFPCLKDSTPSIDVEPVMGIGQVERTSARTTRTRNSNLLQKLANEQAATKNKKRSNVKQIEKSVDTYYHGDEQTETKGEPSKRMRNLTPDTKKIGRGKDHTSSNEKDNNNNVGRPLNEDDVAVITPMDDLMTDDEDDEPVKENSPPVFNIPVIPVKKIGQQLFSHYKNSAVMKKVETFEKLGTLWPTARITRSKTRQKVNTAGDCKSSESSKDYGSHKKMRAAGAAAGCTTPQMTHSVIPSSSASKSQLSNSAKKVLSIMKLSSQQLRNYDQQRKEREAAAHKKKDLMVAKHWREKQRKLEEKEARTKLLYERIMDQQNAKKQEHRTQQCEEADKRNLLMKQKHEEMRREEEDKRNDAVVAQRKLEEDERRRQTHVLKSHEEVEKAPKESKAPTCVVEPIYMTHTAPMLPTPDCYDSDDENAPKRTELPKWNSKEAIHEQMQAMSYIDDRVRNTLFCVKPQTPNLIEIFPILNRKKLQRGSSAMWTNLPRFTMAVLDEQF